MDSQTLNTLLYRLKYLKKEKDRFKEEDSTQFSIKDAEAYFLQRKYIRYQYKKARKELLSFLLSQSGGY